MERSEFAEKGIGELQMLRSIFNPFRNVSTIVREAMQNHRTAVEREIAELQE